MSTTALSSIIGLTDNIYAGLPTLVHGCAAMRSAPSEHAATRCSCSARHQLQVSLNATLFLAFPLTLIFSTAKLTSACTCCHQEQLLEAKAISFILKVFDNDDDDGLAALAADYDLTGQIMWPAAQLLADYLAANTHIMTGCPCALELGSGLGFPGILAGQAGPLCRMT